MVWSSLLFLVKSYCSPDIHASLFSKSPSLADVKINFVRPLFRRPQIFDWLSRPDLSIKIAPSKFDGWMKDIIRKLRSSENVLRIESEIHIYGILLGKANRGGDEEQHSEEETAEGFRRAMIFVVSKFVTRANFLSC